ncbi:MAG: hypothetical protein KGI35_11710 [Burkholderiales bacterium]|nr:hypothetical protein [Burkholderiales bacterium]MDE2395405.1 hypothetical protein [Burkholderiales bacterium]
MQQRAAARRALRAGLIGAARFGAMDPAQAAQRWRAQACGQRRWRRAVVVGAAVGTAMPVGVLRYVRARFGVPRS